MLLEFSFENYGSFRESATLDMRATSYTEHSYFVMENGKYSALPVAAIFGSNASGKSTVIDAFFDMRRYILRSLTLSTNDYTGEAEGIGKLYKPFILSEASRNDVTKFSFVLLNEDSLYTYRFSFNKDGVQEETLTRRKNKPRGKEVVLYTIQKGKFLVTHNEVKSFSRIFEGIDKISLFITFLRNKEQADANSILNWFTMFIPYPLNDSNFIQYTIRAITETYYENAVFNDFCTRILQQIDPCIAGMHIVKMNDDEPTKGKPEYAVIMLHKDMDGGVMPFNFSMESDGTQKVYLLCVQLYLALHGGTPIVIDELDARLHPMVIEYIVGLFHDPVENPGQGQLIFTTHNPVTLNNSKMRRDEIWFTEKDGKGQSSLYSLADIKGVRSDADYLNNYFYGNYGAVPFGNGCDDDAR